MINTHSHPHSNIRTFEHSNISHSNISHSHRGSALLIVLGMLSFMVVSAVGFSIYMRQGRLPSSYLRRNIASRYLVKAALANAIEELDGGFMTKYEIGEEDSNNPDQGRFFGLHDDPYPGVGDDMDRSSMRTGNRKYPYETGKGSYKVSFCENGDYWFQRVFCPFGPLPHPANNTQSLQQPPLTVPTLTLESLAYLPPAIIDDVRKVSRLTRTAQWRTLPYEAGRFAYTAVNVSDLFDVNRLRADVARNSGPDRIALGSLCTSSPDTPTTVEDANVQALEDILAELENKKVGGNYTPFTSLADFNLVAAGVSAYGYAPFMDYVGRSSGSLINNSNAQTANSLFITDTWFPVTMTNTVYDLAGAHQPFTEFNADGFFQLTAASRVNAKDQIGEIFKKNLGIGLAALYDYLDSDNVPLSLALPTVEAVPMVVGVSAPVGLQPTFGEVGAPVSSPVAGLSGTYSDADGNSHPINDITITRTVKSMGIRDFGNRAMVKIVTTFPFKRMKTTNRAKNYSVKGILRVWVAPANMNCRVTDPNVALHPEEADWNSNTPIARNGVAMFPSDPATLSRFGSSDVTTTDQAVDDSVTLMFSNLNLQMPLWYQVEEGNPVSPTASAGGGTPVPAPANYNPSYLSLGKLADDTTAFRPLAADGGIDRNWQDAASRNYNLQQAYPNGVAEFKPADLPSTYRIYAAVWVQILDGSKVVDMVPATIEDDKVFISNVTPTSGAPALQSGEGAPTLNFMNTVDFTYQTAETVLSTPPTFTWGALYAVDPRYNYAPEDWFATASPAASKSEWMTQLGLTGTTSPIFGQDGRDRDIFMFVSDQEYLQSVGELQFLPWVRDFDGNGNYPSGDLPNIETMSTLDNNKSFSNRMSGYQPFADRFLHRDYFWRTYSAYRTSAAYGTVGINPFKLKQIGAGVDGADANIVSGVGGFKLNPFSEDSRVMSAAVIGTPFDYYVASTNDNQTQSGGRKNTLIASLDYKKMIDTYSFGKAATAQMTDDELADIADEIRNSFAGMKSFNMESSWGSLMWQSVTDNAQINDGNKKFLSESLVLSQPLHGVDRKYLYSFWRECFDNRQQLFLIFVRAEPTSIGGGATGSLTSAQLGGRAVALVWRDPTVPTNGSRTKRTAINNRDDFRDFKKDNAPHKTRVLFYHQFD